MLAVQENFHFCAKYPGDVLLFLSTFISVVRQCFCPGVGYAGIQCLSCNCCECCYFLGVLQAALNPGYWSSSSTADNPIEVLNFATLLCILVVRSSLITTPISPPPQINSPHPNPIHQNVFICCSAAGTNDHIPFQLCVGHGPTETCSVYVLV